MPKASATLRGEMQPRTALAKLPLLITPATGNTYNDPLKSVKEHFENYVKEHGLVDATFFHGFSAASPGPFILWTRRRSLPPEKTKRWTAIWRSTSNFSLCRM
ncbi:MAG: M81 family metallopeptidase [Oscillibacter sp.]|nr:M81 family metallopeptidase [Oscillibacter sp.]